VTHRLIYALAEDAPRAVTWHGPFLNHSGYGEEMRGFVTGLRDRGEQISAAPVATSARYLKSLEADRLAQFEAAVAEPTVDHAVQVLHLPPHVLRRLPGAGPHVARSMFETDGLPAGWASGLNQMDEVWVPAAFNVETFRRAGVTAPLRVVPGGVDADVYRPGVAPLQIDGLSGTVFLSVFEWSFRKGWDVLLRAWADAFDHRDDVTLLLRAYPQQDFEGQRPADEIERRINTFLKKIGKSRRRVAPIVVLQEMVSDADMPALYARADAYVSPTRGEGSGRPFLEALSSSLPVLATRWSGHLEFLDDDNSLLIDIEGTEPIDQRQELTFYRGQRWASPSARHLTQLLRSVVEDPAAVAERAARGRQDVLQRFTWEKVSELAAEHLDAIQKQQRPERTRREETPAVRWIGDQWGQHSLSRVNREWCSRVASSGRVELEVMSFEQPKVERGVPGMRALEDATGPVLQRPADVVVRHQWPPDWTAPQEGAWVVVQPWEFGGLPDSWIPALRDEVDEVWCYTTYVRDVYARSGIPAEKLKIVPCGVDTGLFRPDGARYPLTNTKTTKLLFVGGTIARKGIDVLLSTYAATFDPTDDVCLVIKSTGAQDAYQGSAIDEQIRVMAADPLLPSIELVDDELSDEQMAALYRSCDLLVHPYRGEGFALPVAEAMASGLPVVVTAVGACADFCDDSNAYLVPATEVRVTVNDAGPSAAGYFCVDPDADVLSRTLLQAVGDPLGRRDKASRARERIVSDFSWDRAAGLIADRCAVLARGVPTRFVPRQRNADSAFTLDAPRERALLLDGDWQGGEVDRAVRLFAQAWRPARPVTLVLRVPGKLQAAADRVESALREAGVDVDADLEGPDILLVDNVEDDQHLDDLYSSVARVLRSADETSVARAARIGTAVVTADDLPSWTNLLEGLTT
jgi:glycosyltransferase involved in cell wall biosynthesis